MTPLPGGPPATGADAEAELLLRVLSALLREDVLGWRTRSRAVRHPDGLWLRLPTAGRSASEEAAAARVPAPRLSADAVGSGGGDTPAAALPDAPGSARTEDADALLTPVQADALLMPVQADGYQATYAARLPLLRREADGGELTDAGSILAVLRDLADPVDRGGFDAFAAECEQALDTVRTHARTRDEVGALLVGRYGADPGAWAGLGGGLGHDTLAARADHPVYPTSRGRSGLRPAQLRAYAPEFHPTFALRQIALPREAVTVVGGTDVWLSPRAAGVPELEGSHLVLPVHPLTADGTLRDALRAAGLDTRARLLSGPGPDVVPTLSMRTVALASDPTQHLKLPLATSTLGLRNRRTIKPGTLTDGAAGQRLIEAVIDREARFKGVVLHADETRFAHARHEILAVLSRRYPAGLDSAAVVPMAALLCPAPGGERLLIDHLADRFYGGDPLALLDAALTLLFDWQTTLFAYGIALESHQQNISLVMDHHPADGSTGLRTRLRLLFKDNDGPRVNLARLRDVMGQQAPEPTAFDDVRIYVDGDLPVLDVFTTITLHLCAGAYAFGLARQGRGPLEHLLRLVRERLTEAVERLGPGEPAALLRTHVLDAAELPVKAMVTAGTLLSKERSGAADINKHYTTGPNYLCLGGGS
ncbi:IucA/IucC family siderophore biosynthesis protein [Streptomyces sp. NPDC050147]|uniref:IucA/IucC family siderophore biosynthesis protein n=1 Tax=Streptomyces sp. NPDC050147 TaxID=3155513 RepID=UPI0034351179